MNLEEAPRLCWAWSDSGRKTSPSLQWIREITPNVDGSHQGRGLNGYPWLRVQPIEDGHPEPSKEAALRLSYDIRRNREQAVCSAAPIETPQQAPSALSRIWARIRGRE